MAAAKKPRKPRYELIDAEVTNAEHPETFWIPPLEQRKALQPGAVVKCIFSPPKGVTERMWVKITEVTPEGSYRGELENQPVFVHAHRGDTVAFEPRHIIQIHK